MKCTVWIDPARAHLAERNTVGYFITLSVSADMFTILDLSAPDQQNE